MSPATPRSAKDGPWAWASKEALRRICEHFAESNKVPSARSVYLAFCELASNEAAETFQVKVATVARFAGVSVRTVSDVLPELELIQVLAIDRKTIPGSKMDAPSVYTLLSVGNSFAPLGNNCIPLCNGPEQTSVAENLKNSEKNNTEEQGEEPISPSPAAKGVRIHQSLVVSIYQEYPRKKEPRAAHPAIRKALDILEKRGQPDPVAWLKGRVQAYAKTREGEEERFTPYPQKWFNKGCYDDDLTASPSAKSAHAKPLVEGMNW